MFDLSDWPGALARGAVLSALALGWVIMLVRIVGLRSFSKMTAFDFIVTLATGSLLATAAGATSWTAFAQPAAAIATLLGLQYALAAARRGSARFRAMLENEPVMLMRDGAFVDSALRRTRVSRADVMAKLRQANVLDLPSVRAVVLETTGDISVLHGEALDPQLVSGVRRAGDEQD